jgi:trimeric autotransporter adhesin
MFILLMGMPSTFAQAPDIINYQGVARHSNGLPVSNQTVAIRLSIHHLTSNGLVQYSETRSLNTDAEGLFNLQIGGPGAISTTGTWSAITWGAGSKYLSVEMDTAGGTNFINMGSQQLVSVPYAQHAKQSASLMPTAIINPNQLSSGGAAMNQVLKFDGTNWVAGTVTGSGSFTLPYTAADTNGTSFEIVNSNSVNGTAIRGASAGSTNTSFGIYGSASGLLGTGVNGISTGSFGNGVAGTSNSPNGNGVRGSSIDGVGVRGVSTSGIAIHAASTNNNGIYGSSVNGTGIYGFTSGAGKEGVFGTTSSTNGSGLRGYTSNASSVGVRGVHNSTGIGVEGTTATGKAVVGICTGTSGTAIEGTSNGASGIGVVGASTAGTGVLGTASGTTSFGVRGTNTTGTAIKGSSATTSASVAAILGECTGTTGIGVEGNSNGSATSGIGVYGESNNGTGVKGYSNNAGSVAIFGSSLSGTGVKAYSFTGTALDVIGNVKISGGNTNPSAGAVLTSDAGGNATWVPQDLKVAFKGQNVSQTSTSGTPNHEFSSNSFKKVEFFSEDYDLNSNFSPTGANASTSNTSTFLVPVNGIYNFSAAVSVENNLVADYIHFTIRLMLKRGGVNSTIAESQVSGGTIVGSTVNLSIDKNFLANDRVWIEFRQTNYSTLSSNLKVSATGNYFTGHLVYQQ